MAFFMASNEGAGNRRKFAIAHVNAALERMFREQDKERINSILNKSLKEYFFMGIEHCLELAKRGNVDSKKRLPEILFSLALYYESGDTVYGIAKNLEKAKEFLELAVNLETEQAEELSAA